MLWLSTRHVDAQTILYLLTIPNVTHLDSIDRSELNIKDTWWSSMSASCLNFITNRITSAYIAPIPHFSVRVAIFHYHLPVVSMPLNWFNAREDILRTINFLKDASYWWIVFSIVLFKVSILHRYMHLKVTSSAVVFPILT